MKLLALTAVAIEATLFVTVVDVINGVAGSVALLGAAACAVPVLWRATKPVRAAGQHIRDIRAAVLGDDQNPSLRAQLERGQEHFERTDERLGVIEGRVEKIEGHIGVVADAEDAGVRAALAQYERRGPSAA